MENWVDFVKRLPSLYFGLFLFALGSVMILYADLGMSAWGVFQIGLVNVLGLTFGQAFAGPELNLIIFCGIVFVMTMVYMNIKKEFI